MMIDGFHEVVTLKEKMYLNDLRYGTNPKIRELTFF